MVPGCRTKPALNPLHNTIPVVLALLYALIAVGLARAQETFATEAAGAPRPEIPKSLADALDPDGTRLVRLTNGVHLSLGEVWWSKRVATRTVLRKHRDVAYGNLAPGTLLGVLYVPKPAEDFTHHKIEAGFFTMRYVKMPKKKHDEDDDGKSRKDKDEGEENEAKPRISRYRDFVLLTDVAADSRIGDSLDPSQLARLSGKVSRGGEPLALSLIPINPHYKGFPSIVSDDQGFCAVQFKLQASAGRGHSRELDLAILLVNPPNVSADD